MNENQHNGPSQEEILRLMQTDPDAALLNTYNVFVIDCWPTPPGLSDTIRQMAADDPDQDVRQIAEQYVTYLGSDSS